MLGVTKSRIISEPVVNGTAKSIDRASIVRMRRRRPNQVFPPRLIAKRIAAAVTLSDPSLVLRVMIGNNIGSLLSIAEGLVSVAATGSIVQLSRGHPNLRLGNEQRLRAQCRKRVHDAHNLHNHRSGDSHMCGRVTICS